MCFFDTVVSNWLQFIIGPPGPDQWIFMVNGQPQFKLDLFSLKRPLPHLCTNVQLACSNQEAASAKSTVVSCITLHVKVLSIASSCLVIDTIKVSTTPNLWTPCVHRLLRHCKDSIWLLL